MCVIIEVQGSNPYSIGCVRELRQLATVLEADLWPDTTDDECLCSTDIEAVLNRAEIPFKIDDIGDYVVKKEDISN